MLVTTQLTNIDPSKRCLHFLGDRILENDYRGWHLSQHNRYDYNKVRVILEEIYKIARNGLMQIRDQDMSQRPDNIPDEEQYRELTENIKERLGSVTQDSLRKNLFVDMHKMRLIDRYGVNRERLPPDDRPSHVKYIKLAPLGFNLVETYYQGNNTASNSYYVQGLANLSGLYEFVERCLKIMTFLNSSYLTEYESMFFVTALNLDTCTTAHYIGEFRALNELQEQVIRLVQSYCDPNNFGFNKSNKRDFGNWKNETQQIFNLLDQIIPFEYTNHIFFNHIYHILKLRGCNIH